MQGRRHSTPGMYRVYTEKYGAKYTHVQLSEMDLAYLNHAYNRTSRKNDGLRTIIASGGSENSLSSWRTLWKAMQTKAAKASTTRTENSGVTMKLRIAAGGCSFP